MQYIQIDSNENEEKSARLAGVELRKAGINGTAIKTIETLILATKHNGSVIDPDTQYLIGIDLSTFGSAPAVYQEYEHKIRKEYEQVPYSIYKTRRKEILNSFFQKNPIFYTDFFKTKYEEQARTNLKLAIDAL